jgi:hypothetical protein
MPDGDALYNLSSAIEDAVGFALEAGLTVEEIARELKYQSENVSED